MLKCTKPFLKLLCICTLVCACNKKKTLFTSLSSSKTNIDFTNTLEKKPLFNILYYLYYYNGAGVSTGDINNDGLADIYFSANSKGHNKLYLNKGNFEFEDITDKAGVAGTSDWCTGVTMADVNSDGFLDIYVSSVNKKYGLNGHNELFINNGNNSFTEKSREYGLDFSGLTTQAAFFDYDNDGDLDCYLLNQSHHPHANIADTNKRKTYDPLSGDVLYRNDISSTGKFTDVSKQAGISQSNLGYGLGLAIGDINNDGWQDIYIGNDFHENDYYYLNNGNGSFTESGAKVFNHYSRFSMGNDVADYNNDGNLDVVTADMLPDNEKVLKTYGSDENPDIYRMKILGNGYQYQYSKNCLQRNNGNGSSFSEIALQAGVAATDWSWAPLFADFDNDGRKDLFVSSGIVKRPVDLDYIKFISDLDIKKGRQMTDKYDDEAIKSMPDGSSHPYFFRNETDLSFRDVSEDWGTGSMKGFFNGAAYADFDNDGNVDVVINCIDRKATILKNTAPKKNFLSISFRSDSGNRFGLGAKAYVFTKNRMQYQQLMLTRGFQSSCEARLHFGLDSASVVDSVLIVWPDRKFQVLKNVKANQQLVVSNKNASGVFDHSSFFPAPSPKLTQLNDILINWQHRENNFFDFNVQYLIPHAQSTRGPKLAVGDVNADGLDDLFVCGAKDQPGSLFIQQSSGAFMPVDTAVFTKDAASEDVDALFLDVNGDSFPDLYVVSGGNEYTGQNPALPDRLYLNDGKGHFTKSATSIPQVFENKSCVTAADVDHDGDQDIFVGTLTNSRSYGVPQTSYLLINDGKGNFSTASGSQIALSNIGTVTCASFADFNRDGWMDLAVSGEWMPLTIFINHNGNFQSAVLPKSTGWWQTIYPADVNGDGFTDLLAGNWGWNNKFKCGKNGPAYLYVSDFDKNGQVDQLLSYTLNGKEYPFLAKDEVERALPVLRKHYLLYSEYAGLEMKDAFYGFVDTMQPLKAECFGSAVCYGDGKGNFTFKELPAELQLAPIFSFQKVDSLTSGPHLFLSGGNFFDVIPYEGRYDAQPLALFGSNRQNELQFIPESELYTVKEQVRDIKRIRTVKHGPVLVVARNNGSLLFYSFKNQ